MCRTTKASGEPKVGRRTRSRGPRERKLKCFSPAFCGNFVCSSGPRLPRIRVAWIDHCCGVIPRPDPRPPFSVEKESWRSRLPRRFWMGEEAQRSTCVSGGGWVGVRLSRPAPGGGRLRPSAAGRSEGDQRVNEPWTAPAQPPAENPRGLRRERKGLPPPSAGYRCKSNGEKVERPAVGAGRLNSCRGNFVKNRLGQTKRLFPPVSPMDCVPLRPASVP